MVMDELWHHLSANGMEPLDEFPEQPQGFGDQLSDAAGGIADWNRSFSQGFNAYMTQHRIVKASAEVWNAEGGWSFAIELDDGSIISIPGEAYAKGPVEDILTMAGAKTRQTDDITGETYEPGHFDW